MGESLLADTAKVMPSGKLSLTPASETVGAVPAETRAGKSVVADITMAAARRRAGRKEKWEMRNAKVDAGRPGHERTTIPPQICSRRDVFGARKFGWSRE